MWRHCYASGALRKTLLMTSPPKSCSIPWNMPTSAELAFEALKGADAAVADVLVAAASAADCDLHLALVSITESGSAEHIGYYGSRRRRWSDEEDEEDFEVSEVHDRHEMLSDWRRPDGSQMELGALPFMEDELCPPDAFEDLEPDEQYFHEATGNEGASFERTYRRAAMVLWPRARQLAVLNQAGLAVTLPYLGDLTGRWTQSGEGPASPLWRDARTLRPHAAGVAKAGRLVSREDRDAQRRRHIADPAESPAGCGTYRHFSGHPRRWCLQQGRQRGDRAGRRSLAAGAGAALIEHLIASQAVTNLSACGDLLARSVAARITGRAADLNRAATALVEALPGDPARTPARPWSRSSPWNPASSLTS